MHWMSWVRGEPLNICTVTPGYRAVTGKRKLSGWLMAKDGCLNALYEAGLSGGEAPVFGPAGKICRAAATIAGGLRPGGAGRLTGVLHYFTRGPDSIL